MSKTKKIFTDGVTIVDQDLLNSIFGGDDSKSTAIPIDPNYQGHLHDLPPDQVGSNWGHAGQIDLTNHIKGRLTLPQPELKSIRFSATQAVPLTSSLFWNLPIPADAYTATALPMYLKLFWSANGPVSPGNVAFRIDWTYIQAGQNVIPPSVISRGPTSWPANTIGSNNPSTSTFRFRARAGVSASILYVNDSVNNDNYIQMVLPTNVTSATLANFFLLGLEISSAPTVTLTNPMTQVNVFAIEISYFSSTLGFNNPTPIQLSNDPGLADF